MATAAIDPFLRVVYDETYMTVPDSLLLELHPPKCRADQTDIWCALFRAVYGRRHIGPDRHGLEQRVMKIMRPVGKVHARDIRALKLLEDCTDREDVRNMLDYARKERGRWMTRFLKISHVDRISHDAWTEVARYLTLPEIAALSTTSKQMRAVVVNLPISERVRTYKRRKNKLAARDKPRSRSTRSRTPGKTHQLPPVKHASV